MTAAISGWTDQMVVMTPTLTPLRCEKYMVMNMELMMPKKKKHMPMNRRRCLQFRRPSLMMLLRCQM